jgi:SAM-dependent methyltransferase
VSIAAQFPDTVDPVGIETLLRMADVDAYNDWIFHKIWPYLGERVLEVGCGIGNMTGYYADRSLLVCVDLLAESLKLARDKIGSHPNLQLVQGDICEESTVARLKDYNFDTAVMLNVLEHIPDDARALAAIHRLLAPGGRLLLLVPAARYLYGTLDRALGHYRRYEREPLRQLVEQSGYRIETLHYMNLPGILGWFLNGRVFRRELLPKPQLALFNALSPFFERVEAAIPPPRGQSLVAICRK